MERPKRRIEMVLKIGADDMDSLRSILRSESITLEPVEERNYESFSGGYDGNHRLTIVVNPEVSHDSYVEALEAYIKYLNTVD